MSIIEINKNPTRRELNWFGLMFAAFFGIVGAVILFRFGGVTTARVMWAVAGGITVLYYLLPPLRRRLYLGWMYAAYPIGWVVSHVMLGLIYYGVFTPIGLVMRLGGRDTMHRRPDPAATTYWVGHRPSDDPGRYFRQF